MAKKRRPARVQVEHSTDGGKTWTLIEVHPGSVVANGMVWADEFGNLYREVRP